MKGQILELLEKRGSLAYEQIAAQLREPPIRVRTALAGLREHGLVDVLSLGDGNGRTTHAAASWRLTDEGRAELDRKRDRSA